MYKKIFGFFIILCILLVPQLAFADSLYFETRMEEHTLKLNIDDTGDLDMKSSDGVSNTSFNLNVGIDTVLPIFDFFNKNIRIGDEVDYMESPILENLTDSPESYVLSICENKTCKTYFSKERPLFTIEELENSEIFTVLETQLETFLEKVILLASVIAIVAIFIPILILVIVITKLSKRKRNNTGESIDSTNRMKQEVMNRLQQMSREIEYKNNNNYNSEKRNPWNKKDDDDPFSL